ncbi:MAG: O-antigen ligase family protein [Saprospiraceae bacterium]|nr:O-antigen ligase family protein [Saprospiraceae bacterium]
MESSSGAERRFVWYKTRELIKDKWITGYGAGSWKLVFPSKSIEGSYRLQSQNIMFTRAHNDFLEIWAETGILGILNYIGLFLIVLLHLYHSFKSEESQRRILTLVLMLLLGGYIIIAFFDFPKERVEHTVLLSLLFAMATKNQVTPLQQYSYLSKGKKFKLFYGLMIFILIANSLFLFIKFKVNIIPGKPWRLS